MQTIAHLFRRVRFCAAFVAATQAVCLLKRTMDDDSDWGQFDDDVDAAGWGDCELDCAPVADAGSCPVRDLASALGRRSPVSVADAEAHADDDARAAASAAGTPSCRTPRRTISS